MLLAIVSIFLSPFSLPLRCEDHGPFLMRLIEKEIIGAEDRRASLGRRACVRRPKAIRLEVPTVDELQSFDSSFFLREFSFGTAIHVMAAMAALVIDKRMLRELESMGFPTIRATRALYYSGNSSIEDAINWVLEHEGDSDVDHIPQVPIDIQIESGEPLHTGEEVEMKLKDLRWMRNVEEAAGDPTQNDDVAIGGQGSGGNPNPLRRGKNREVEILEGEDKMPSIEPISKEEMSSREQAQKKREDDERRMEREQEKERIRRGKRLMEDKRTEEENERQRITAFRKAEKEEEKKARQKIRQQLELDKAERRRKLGLPPENPRTGKPTPLPIREGNVIKGPKSIIPSMEETMKDCLRSLKKNHKDDDAKVKKAFQTLLTYVANVVRNPDNEKYRKIRLSNPLFQDRVAKFKEGVEFLELCGFHKLEDNEFLYMPRNKVEMAILNSAGLALNSALTNPYFGMLSL
ncbi:hypothetical protein M5K25_010737 [Dendrobium thyrsiflorum]|uniref:UBA domain-containing protein n=1 Tax=Dendrobium thyrsiflorum TaxID=117978 RepID=A0ABD0V1E4_DENTH